MKLYELFVLIVCAAFLSCAGGDANKFPEFRRHEAFRLKAGETAQWAEDPTIHIRFDSVSSDSRCPQGVQCVWAGRAVVEFTYVKSGEERASTLIMGDPAGTEFSNQARFGEFNLHLRQVLPHPIAEQKILQEQYEIELEAKPDDQ